jgi:exodeoxyribonuclease VIII
MKMYKNLMIDLETMGNGSVAAFTSISAVAFNPFTGDHNYKFECHVDLQSAFDHGLTPDASTVIWWLKQGENARRMLTDGQAQSTHIMQALSDFAHFIQTKTAGVDDICVWGNGATFDISILENAYKKGSLEVPWKSWNVRDVRTISALIPSVKKNTTFKGIKHHGISNCLHQVEYVSCVYRILNQNFLTSKRS